MKSTSLLRFAFAAAAAFGGPAGAAFAPNPDDYVRAILPLPDGDILVGGKFGQIGGTPHSYLARLEPDGSVDASFVGSAYGGSFYGVMAIARQADGKILIGGSFDQVDGVAREALARLNADGSLDTSFAALDFAADGSAPDVGGILVQADGKILIFRKIVGYGFVSIDGRPFPAGIARLNSDGSLDQTFALPDSADGGPAGVYSAALQADGKILVGGYQFTDSGTLYGVQRLNPDGSLDAGFQTSGIDNLVSDILVQGDGAVVISGRFTTPFKGIARLHADGSLDGGFDAGTRLNFSSIDQAGAVLQGDGKLLVAGNPVGSSDPAIVRVDADGTPDPSFADPRITYPVVFAMSLQADGKLLAGGYFQQVGDYARNNLVRLDPDGHVDLPRYSVTPVPGANGAFSPATPQSVREGETARFTILPDAGHHLDSIGGCGGSMQGAYYVTGPITSDCAITATFAAPEQAFTVTPNPAYTTTSPAAAQTVRFGQTASFTLTPGPGFYLSRVAGCGGALDGSVFTTAPVSADCTVMVESVAPSRTAATGGSPQSAVVGAPFAQPLSVRVTSWSLSDGRPVAGVPVRFEVPADGPSAILSSATALTDENGIASVNAIANGVAGGYAVKAVVDAIPLQPAYFTLSNETQDGSDLEFHVTMSTEPPPACGTATSLDVSAGTPINYCFTVVNHGPVALNYQTLGRWPLHFFWIRDHDHALYLEPVSIPPGGSYRYNKVMTVGSEDVDERYTWNAMAEMPRYTVDQNATEAFVDISDTGTALTMDDRTAAVPMPFAWNFYGVRYSPEDGYHLCINAVGSIVLSLADTPDYCPPYFRGANGTLESTFANGILPYWDGLGDGGAVYMQVTGEAPHRRLIVQWQNKDHETHPNPDSGITFEAIVDETSGRIAFVYRDLDFKIADAPSLNYGGSATVGLWGNDAVDATLLQQPPLHDGQAIVLTPTPAPHVASAETHLRIGTPLIQVAPAMINASAAAGTSTSREIRIGNDGNLPLQWSLARAESNAHFPPALRWAAPAEAPPRWDSSTPIDAAARLSNGNGTNAAMTIPAYGAMQEGTSGYPTPNWFVGFDAAGPDYFAPIPTVAYNVLAGDFIDDDFTKEYVIYRDTDLLTSSIAIADLVDGGIYPISNLENIDKRWSGMAWDRTTGKLYASAAVFGDHGEPCDQQSMIGGSALYTLDPHSGQIEAVGDIVFDDARSLCVSDIAISPGGLMYGIDLLNDALLAIDKTNGQAAVIGSLGVDLKEINSIDFDDVGGTLYLAAEHFADFDAPDSGGIYTIDLTTGLARRLARYPLSPDNNSYLQIDALAIARAGGHCAFPGEISWLRNDVGSGTTAPGQQSPVTLTLDASGLATGDYAANVCISSNDRSQSLLAVPVAFTVTDGPGDTIFGNGFDDTAH